MKKKYVFGFIRNVLISVLLIPLCGCFWGSAPYTPVKHYDLAIPRATLPAGCSVRVNLFAMEAPTKYKMAYTSSVDGFMIDEYNKWAQPPGFMLTRYLQTTFSKNIGSTPENVDTLAFFTLDGTIFIFEINLDNNEVILGIRYSLKKQNVDSYGITRSVITREKFKKISPESFAMAMSSAAGKLAKTIKNDLESIKNSIKDKRACEDKGEQISTGGQDKCQTSVKDGKPPEKNGTPTAR
jgi:hypothetical protein